MPATAFPARHGSNVVGRRLSSRLPDSVEYREVKTPHALLQKRISEASYLQSSFEDDYGDFPARTIHTTQNGFLHSCIRAYFDHHHLILRPDDVWLSIMTQLNMYIRANAEKLRDRFVTHKGQKLLEIEISGSSKTDNEPCTLGFAAFARNMVAKMQENITDKELSEWVIPNFSTTTENDKVVASIVFMGSMSKYFSYGGRTSCGIPSVTLLGTQQDWETMLQKIDKIPSLGKEPTEWHKLLVVILKGFVTTFTHPSSTSTKDFWQKIVHHIPGGSGQPNHYSGWLTAFSFWTDDGLCLNTYKERRGKNFGEKLKMDGAIFPRIQCGALVQGHVNVDVQINDEAFGNGVYMTTMYAGSVGMEVSASGDHGEDFDTVAPTSGWWVYLKDEGKDKTASEGQKSASIDSRRKIWSQMIDEIEVESEIADAA